MRVVQVTVLSAFTLLGGFAVSARASFPGVNGRIVFERSTAAVNQIYSIAPDGSSPVNLSNSTASDESPVYSPDGQLIAFTRDSGSGPAIWVMNANGANQHQISTPGSGEGDVQPAFSPDGQQIVFERDSSLGTNPPELLFVVNVNGTGQHQLETPPSGFYDETPTWSPDGTKIAFMREPTDDSAGQIMIISASGTGSATAVSHPPSGYKDSDPNFSPDGSKIVFSRSQAAELAVASNVIVVNVSTGVEVPLTNDTAATFENEDPAFSADGKLIVYGRYDDTKSSNPTKQLFLMSAADGSGKHAITPVIANQLDGVPNVQPLAPRLTALTVTPSKVSIAGRRVKGKCVKPTKKNKFRKQCRLSVKLTVSYTLNGSESVTSRLTRSLPGRQVNGRCVKQTNKNKKRKRCTIPMLVRRSTSQGAAGTNTVSLDAKALGPGSYTLTITPSAAGRTGVPQTASFTVLS